MPVNNSYELKRFVDSAVREVRVTDIHTHLYSAQFDDMLLWGIDDLLTYHYLVAEFFRYTSMPYEDFWALAKQEQADLIWQTLFIQASPVSEATRGVITVLKGLGLDPGARDLEVYRTYFSGLRTEDYIKTVFEVARIKDVVMTNDPFDDEECLMWQRGIQADMGFHSALRLDVLLNDWQLARIKLGKKGYLTSEILDEQTIAEVKRFLLYWVDKMNPIYMAVSLASDFAYPDDSIRTYLLEECILPVCRQLNMPLALMIGTKRSVNPDLRLAGDSLGKSDISALENLCSSYPNNKFMVTMLAREDQHELCVTARKFKNLMVFGSWWFLNNPSLIEEITRMRMELLGLSFIPQHSDARVLDQLIYKWGHSRQIIASVLYDKYKDLLDAGWRFTEEEIIRDVKYLFGGSFWEFTRKAL